MFHSPQSTVTDPKSHVQSSSCGSLGSCLGSLVVWLCSPRVNSVCILGWPGHALQTYASQTQIRNDKLANLINDDPDIVTSDDFLSNMLGTTSGVARSLRGLVARAGLTSMSTAYSGIDSPGTAVMSFLAMSQSLGFHVSEPAHFFAVEMNVACQRELQWHPSTATCIFGNLESFLHEHLKLMLPELVRTDKLRTVLQPVIMENPAKAVSLNLACPCEHDRTSLTASLRLSLIESCLEFQFQLCC